MSGVERTEDRVRGQGCHMTTDNSGPQRASADLRPDGMPVGKPFEKGKSPNPGGRPKIIADVKAELEAGAVPAAKKMTSLIHHEDPKVAIAAAKDVIDRVLGKAKEAGEGETRTTLAAFFAGMMSRMSAAEVQAATDEAEDGGADA